MTMAVAVDTGHAAQLEARQVSSSKQVSNQDEIRQVTRTIKIMDPYKGTQTIKQTVTFKKVANNWQPQAPGIWPSFFSLNYDDFEPDILQVRAQPVTANDSDQTISVTYHQYKIPDRQRLVKVRPTFYGYDNNFKFHGQAWNSKLLAIGQWYDVPPAPEGFEYCYPETLPKRLKLYQSRQEPFKVLIRPVQKLVDQVIGKDEKQPAHQESQGHQEPQEQATSQPKEKETITTGSQTGLVTSHDSETQTPVIQKQDQEQQTTPSSKKDEEVQIGQLVGDAGSQTDNHGTSTGETQTEEVPVKHQESQTIESPKNDHPTQITSNEEAQSSQTIVKAKTDPSSQATLTEGQYLDDSVKQEVKGDASVHKEGSKVTQPKEGTVNHDSTPKKDHETQTPVTQSVNKNRQATESTQPDSLITSASQPSQDKAPIEDADIQKILDQDSASLKELGGSKNHDKHHKTKLPQTGNQTDNRTTLIGLVITGLVALITMVFWKQRKKE